MTWYFGVLFLGILLAMGAGLAVNWTRAMMVLIARQEHQDRIERERRP